MRRDAGKSVSLSLGRRWINDLLAVSRDMPMITIERRMNIGQLASLRSFCTPRPAWSILFSKAYAIVASRRPELRRAYVGFPWPHLFESNENIAVLAVERKVDGESVVFFGRVREPNRQPLGQLALILERWKTEPIHKIKEFRRLERLSRWPWLLRRAIWWWGMNISGRRRMKNFGTFGVSVTSAEGALCKNLISPLATNLNYGVIQADGSVTVQLHFDHRVIDGMPAARALHELEEVMNQELCQELRQQMIPARLIESHVNLVSLDW